MYLLFGQNLPLTILTDRSRSQLAFAISWVKSKSKEERWDEFETEVFQLIFSRKEVESLRYRFGELLHIKCKPRHYWFLRRRGLDLT